MIWVLTESSLIADLHHQVGADPVHLIEEWRFVRIINTGDGFWCCSSCCYWLILYVMLSAKRDWMYGRELHTLLRYFKYLYNEVMALRFQDNVWTISISTGIFCKFKATLSLCGDFVFYYLLNGFNDFVACFRKCSKWFFIFIKRNFYRKEFKF